MIGLISMITAATLGEILTTVAVVATATATTAVAVKEVVDTVNGEK